MKTKKLRKNTIIIIISITIILLSLIIGYIYYNKTYYSKKYYSNKAIEAIKVHDIKNIYKEEYSKTLDIVLTENLYEPQYLKEYQRIEFINQDDFIDKIIAYLNIGYSGNEINNIFKLSKINQDKLLNLEKIDFTKYLNIQNFDVNKIERYNKYLDKTKKDLNTVVTYVNINLDNKFYTNTNEVNNPNDLTVIVNKYNYITKDFIPKNLVTLFDSKNGAKMVKEAAEAYKLFIEASKKDGLTLESTTAYRSYSFQNTLYTNYVAQDGKEKADTYSARPGTSEHQLGLAVDLNNPNHSGARLSGSDYEWVLNNSYKYGFIIRYTEKGVPITGYMEEPWHIRYLGVDLATKVFKSGLTYEEYYDLYIAEY